MAQKLSLRLLLAVSGLSLGMGAPLSSFATEPGGRARLRLEKGPAADIARRSKPSAIQSLSWDALEYELTFEEVDHERVPVVEITGTFARSDWTLLCNEQKAPMVDPVRKPGRFRIRVFPRGETTLLSLIAVGPKGVHEESQASLEIDAWETVHPQGKAAPSEPRRFSISPAVAYSLLSYTETDAKYAIHVDARALTAKVMASYLLAPPRWDLGFAAFATAVPLGSDVAGTRIGFLGLNARLGYVVPGLSEPWKLTIMGGAYYTTMAGTDAAGRSFGFAGLMGPQLYPSLRRTLANGDTVSGYLKFATVGNGESFFDLGNREIAAGVSWGHRLRGRHPIQVSLDVAKLDFSATPTGNAAPREFQNKSYSLGAAYTF